MCNELGVTVGYFFVPQSWFELLRNYILFFFFCHQFFSWNLADLFSLNQFYQLATWTGLKLLLTCPGSGSFPELQCLCHNQMCHLTEKHLTVFIINMSTNQTMTEEVRKIGWQCQIRQRDSKEKLFKKEPNGNSEVESIVIEINSLGAHNSIFEVTEEIVNLEIGP